MARGGLQRNSRGPINCAPSYPDEQHHMHLSSNMLIVREEYDLLMSDGYGSSLTKVRIPRYAELSRPGQPYADRERRKMFTQTRIRHD
jgi:hypothetical protein